MKTVCRPADFYSCGPESIAVTPGRGGEDPGEGPGRQSPPLPAQHSPCCPTRNLCRQQIKTTFAAGKGGTGQAARAALIRAGNREHQRQPSSRVRAGAILPAKISLDFRGFEMQTPPLGSNRCNPINILCFWWGQTKGAARTNISPLMEVRKGLVVGEGGKSCSSSFAFLPSFSHGNIHQEVLN